MANKIIGYFIGFVIGVVIIAGVIIYNMNKRISALEAKVK